MKGSKLPCPWRHHLSDFEQGSYLSQSHIPQENMRITETPSGVTVKVHVKGWHRVTGSSSQQTQLGHQKQSLPQQMTVTPKTPCLLLHNVNAKSNSEVFANGIINRCFKCSSNLGWGSRWEGWFQLIEFPRSIVTVWISSTRLLKEQFFALIGRNLFWNLTIFGNSIICILWEIVFNFWFPCQDFFCQHILFV